jgi:hypothetical protein
VLDYSDEELNDYEEDDSSEEEEEDEGNPSGGLKLR